MGSMKVLNEAARIAARFTPILICTAAALIIGTATEGSPAAHAGGSPALAIDLDVTDGACADIDAARTLAPGDPAFNVAVCLTNNPTSDPVAAFGYHVTYNDTIIQAPNVCEIDSDDPTPPPDCAAPALNYNPNANQGNESSTPGLGGGWDCSGGVGAFPRGDVDDAPGNGTGDAYSGGCLSAAGPNTLVTGPLGVITFNVVGGGVTNLAITNTTITGDSGIELGSCDPVGDIAMTCTGATVTVSGATATPATPTNTPTQTNTPLPGTSASPTHVTNESSSTPTPSATGQATTVPGETPGAPPPPPPGGGAQPTAPGGRPGGVGVTGPDTGAGSASGSGSSMNLVLIAASGALFVAAGAGVAWRRRRQVVDVD
jgi:hypothetical protein